MAYILIQTNHPKENLWNSLASNLPGFFDMNTKSQQWLENHYYHVL